MRKYRKILLATMSFDIGGVETHILELAIGLKKAGYRPIVVSNGGVFEASLREAGIKHYKAPLHSKNVKNMWRSYWLLKKIIVRERIDVVHAHARIPAFILGFLHRQMGFPFVTSVHALFNTTPLYRLNSNWGEACIAVSEDLKQYLISCYKIDPSDIIVTINGVDTEKFCRDIDFSDIVREFRLDTNRTIIGHVSRLDRERSLVARYLVSIARDIYKRFPNSLLLIVGDGEDFNLISRLADDVNRSLGFRFVIMTGARTDINKFIAVSDVFVGVSRAVLEAMSCEKPSIIAGNEGYIGVFSRSNLAVARNSNFTCRGERPSSPRELRDDLFYLLSSSPEFRLDIGAFSREVILSDYSVTRMTRDNIKLYKRVLGG